MSNTDVTELIVFDHDAHPRLPDTTTIIEACVAHNEAAESNMKFIRGICLDDCTGTQRVWVKYGWISMAEARTQDYVAHAINNTDAPVRVPRVYAAFRDRYGWAYIAMEFIEGSACRNADALSVARAVAHLTNLSPPSEQTRPGPVGGGPVAHALFEDCRSPVEYPSCAALQAHINGVRPASSLIPPPAHATQILRHMRYKERVDFAPELAAHGLRLCLSDLTADNFLKAADGTIVALDFGEACFLPVSFFRLILTGHYNGWGRLCALLAPASTPPEPKLRDANLRRLDLAAGALVITCNNGNRLGARVSRWACAARLIVYAMRAAQGFRKS